MRGTVLPRILSDAEIDLVPMDMILRVVRAHLLADARGEATSPPRHYVPFPTGSIAFTVGGNGRIAGFRAYETFSGGSRITEDQIVVLWDQVSCRMRGISIGNRLGAIRTGALGGIAVDIMVPSDAKVCAVIGTGVQAETQVLAIASIRELREVRVYSRSAENRAAFAEKLTPMTGLKIHPMSTAKACVEGAEIVVLATDSTVPVIDADWIMPGAHVSTLGSKLRGSHELPLELALRAAVTATDSPQQTAAHADRHMLHGSPAFDRIRHLGTLAPGHDPRGGTGMTLFLSEGLAGSEVAALEAALNHYQVG
jgi:ornithine cyclodeaminase